MKTKYTLASLTVAALAMLALASCKHEDPKADTVRTHYTCEMHPEVVTATPGKCPKCGMELTEKK